MTMFYATHSDDQAEGALCGLHDWVVENVTVGGDDGTFHVETVCRLRGALRLTSYGLSA